MKFEDPIETYHLHASGDEDEDWDDEAAEEQSEEHDDRGSDPEPVQR